MNAVTFAEDILAMSRELDRLRKEVVRLKHYEAEYNTLVHDSIRHSEKMTANTMDLIMKPGVNEALQASMTVQNPISVFNYAFPNLSISTQQLSFHAVLLSDKYASFPTADIQALESSRCEVTDIKIKNPNNPAQLLEAKLISFNGGQQ